MKRSELMAFDASRVRCCAIARCDVSRLQGADLIKTRLLNGLKPGKKTKSFKTPRSRISSESALHVIFALCASQSDLICVIAVHSFSANQIDDGGAEAIARLLQSVNTPGTSVDFRKNELTTSSLSCLADALKSSPMVTSLQLDKKKLNDDDEVATEARLSSSTPTTTKTLSTVALFSQIEFHLRRNNQQHQRRRWLHRVELVRISALEVEKCHIDHVPMTIADADLLCAALRSNQSVTDLRLRDNALSAEAAKRVLRSLESNQNITSLALMDNNIGDSGMKALGDLMHHKTALRSLVVSNSVHLREDPTDALSLVHVSPRTASRLHYAFANVGLVTSLTLANCGLSDRDIGVIVSGIAWSCQMEELVLRNNAFGDNSVSVIARMAMRCQRLRHLDVVRQSVVLLMPMLNLTDIDFLVVK